MVSKSAPRASRVFARAAISLSKITACLLLVADKARMIVLLAEDGRNRETMKNAPVNILPVNALVEHVDAEQKLQVVAGISIEGCGGLAGSGALE